MSRLSGKVAIITGASGGIGSAAAIQFAREGANVVLQYMSRVAEAEAVADKLTTFGKKALLAHVDFTNVVEAPGEVQEMVNGTIRQFGKVDVLLNLAGYPARGEWNKRFMELTPEDFFKPINVDLFGSFLCARAVATHFLKQKSGVIVNVSSRQGFCFYRCQGWDYRSYESLSVRTCALRSSKHHCLGECRNTMGERTK